METRFSPDQLTQPAMAGSEAQIRKCVHCGFCTATCPTYVLLGDELDSPRGRIYLIKDMLENERQPSAEVVKHIDRCLSCLSCVTTCPSGVDYRQLIDHARAYVEDRYRRPLPDRLYRSALAAILPRPGLFRAALALARVTRPVARLLPRHRAFDPMRAMLALAPNEPSARAQTAVPSGPAPRGRVVLLQGCAEPVLQPHVRAAAIRLLTRAGYEVTLAAGETCCGSLTHHLGREEAGLRSARRNVDVWTAEIERGGLAAVVITASGCGSTIKTYGEMLRHDPAYATKAASVSALARDIVELIDEAGLPPVTQPPALRVAYHAACSLQHGQQIRAQPKRLLASAGFTVVEPAEAHLCCGSAGTYNLLQPDIAARLGERKVSHLEATRPDVIAAGNIGCAMQIAALSDVPVVHTLELLDWATGGPRPAGLPSAASAP